MMITYDEAKFIAEEYIYGIGLNIGEKLSICDAKESASGWCFAYQGTKYLESNEISDILLGCANFFINKFSKELVVFGTAYSCDHYIEQYESSVKTDSAET